MGEVTFGRYRLIEVIGRGGMGTVYRAHDTVIDREVAIKVLPTELATEPGYRERFRREAHIAARLAEPHIVPIYDTGEIDGQLYLAMPVVDGVDLTSVLRRDGALEPASAVRVIEQLAAALDAAHKRGLAHRDVKPSNALVTPGEFVYLIDFGIAHDTAATRLTRTGMTVGTWAYMAPERFSAGVADARGDVYALACVLYECLTGQPAVPGDTLEQQFAGHLMMDPPKPSASNPAVPTGFDEVIARGMAKNPDRRYQTAGELASGARRALTETAAPAPPTDELTPIERPTVPISATQPADASILSDPTLPAAPQVKVDKAHEMNQPPTQLANTQLAPPPPFPPWAAQPIPKRSGRRTRVLIASLAGVVALLIAAGIFAGVKLSQPHKPAATTAPTTTPANPGPFTGTYRANFATPTGLDNEPHQGGTPDTDTWALRSVCRPTGCVATASRLSGTSDAGTTMVFDQIGDNWMAVAVTTKPCNNAPTEFWAAVTLQPRADGTFTGEFRGTTGTGCREKQLVTFTRTGDVDVNSLPDPATLPPRVLSPAQALHGHYDEKRTFANKSFPSEQADYAVATDCLRTGDRCMSFFHAIGHNDRPLVFSAGNWTMDLEYDVQCPGGSAANHVKQTAQYPLPVPPQDPITVLTGHGQQAQSGGCNALSVAFDETFTRTGD
jgi:serine/threonine protein kinase